MAHHSDTQPRAPKGAPQGGEWTQMEGDVASFDLRELTDDEYNADGSFEYPPAPRSAEQVIAFWAKVQVPDTILEKTKFAFEGKRKQERGALEESLRGRYSAALPPVKLFKDVVSADPDYLEAVNAAGGIDEYVTAALEADGQAHPAVMREDDIRAVVRSAQAWWQAQQLPAADRDEVLAEPVFIHARGGQTLTVAEMEDRYGLNRDEWAFRANGVFKDHTRWDSDDIARMRTVVDRIEDWVSLPMVADDPAWKIVDGKVAYVPEGKTARR